MRARYMGKSDGASLVHGHVYDIRCHLGENETLITWDTTLRVGRDTMPVVMYRLYNNMEGIVADWRMGDYADESKIRMGAINEIDDWVKGRVEHGGDDYMSWKYNSGYKDALLAMRSYLHRLRENERNKERQR